MKKISMMLSMLVIMVALFANTVMADGPCTPIQGPFISETGGKWKWAYTFSGTITPSTLLYILAPVCTPATLYTVDPAGQVLPPGVGDSTTGFGVGDMSNVTIKLTYSSVSLPPPAPQNGHFYFYTDKFVPLRSTPNGMQYKSGRAYSICPAVGPACPGIPAAVLPSPNTECKKVLDSTYLLVTRDPSTLCRQHKSGQWSRTKENVALKT